MIWRRQLPPRKFPTTLSPLFRLLSSIVLRPYQEECLESCLAALQSGVTRIGVSLPTGSGKTSVFVSLLSRIHPKSPVSTRALIVVNSVELARQACHQVSTMFPHWTVEIEQGQKYKASGRADVTVATYQTLLQPERLAKFDPKSMKAVVIDEAHHAAAPSYRRLLAHFHPAIKHPDSTFKPPLLSHPIPIIGFSATLSRHDGLALGSVFERIVYHRDFLAMIKEEWLCSVRFTTVRAKLDLESVTVSSRTGDFNPTSLAQVVNTESVNRLVVQTWLDRASARKSTLVFCVNLAHVEALTQTFRSFGIDARYVTSKTPVAERKALVASFKAGAFPILINCAILTEGADIPNIDCVLVARPTRSRNVFTQMIGRGMRLSPSTGKTDCHIIDFVESSKRVSGVMASPTLFGLDPDDTFPEDETLESLEQRAAAKLMGTSSRDNIPDPTSVTYTDFNDPLSFIQSPKSNPYIATLSKNAWVACGGDIYVLECFGKGFIRVEHIPAAGDVGQHYAGYFTPAGPDFVTAMSLKLNMSPFLRRRQILTAPDLGAAIRGCDTYAATKVVRGPLALALMRSAKWRQTDATESQLKLIAKRLKQPSRALNKGEAADIITKLKNGGKGRSEKEAKKVAKYVRATTKEEARLARETVRVGPLHDPTSP